MIWKKLLYCFKQIFRVFKYYQYFTNWNPWTNFLNRPCPRMQRPIRSGLGLRLLQLFGTWNYFWKMTLTNLLLSIPTVFAMKNSPKKQCPISSKNMLKIFPNRYLNSTAKRHKIIKIVEPEHSSSFENLQISHWPFFNKKK